MARNNRQLVLDISGDISQLDANMKAARSLLLDFGSSSESILTKFERELSALGGEGAATSAKQIEREYNRMFKSIAANAKAVVGETNAGTALQLLDVGAAEEQVRALTQEAALLREVAAASEIASREGGEYSDIQRTAAVQATAAASAAEDQAAALTKNIGAFKGIQAAAGSTATTMKQGTQITAQKRAGLQQLGYQLNDVATQYALGAKPAQIFSAQIGQVTQAVQMMSGGTSKFASFLGGPWGIALGVGVTLLAPFVGKLLEGNNVLDDAIEKLRKDAQETEASGQAKALFGKTLEGVSAALRENAELLEKSSKAQWTAGQQSLIAADISRQNILVLQKENDELREKRKSLLELAILEQSGGAFGVEQALAQERAVREARQALKDIEEDGREIAEKRALAEKQILQSKADIAAEAAKRALDASGQIERAYDKQVQAAKKAASAAEIENGTLATKITLIEKQRQAALKAARDTKRTSNGAGASSQASLGDMRALIGQLFPGATITSAYRKGDKGDHGASRALDFVPAGGMGSISTAQVEAILKGAGVDIRRNGNGTQQLFGPGRAANKPGDHDDHFHFAWQGSAPDPDKVAEKRAQEAAKAEEERIARERRYAEQLDQANAGLLNAQLSKARSADERLAIELELLRGDQAARTRAIDQAVIDGDLTQAQADALKAIEAKTDAIEEAGMREEARQQLLDDQLETERNAIEGKIGELRLQTQFADTLDERRRLALQILELELEERRRVARRLLASDDPLDRARGQADLLQIDRDQKAGENQIGKEYADPVERYLERLRQMAADTETALDEVRANGLQSLEDGLVGVITGTESVSSAFKKMANQIIADLVRIMVQKMILGAVTGGGGGLLSIFGLAEGGKVEGFAGGGVISGPGTGTSDSIMALVDGRRPILVSNGEAIMTAEAVDRYWPILDAMNKGAIPAFADGGRIGSALRAPSARSLSGGAGGRTREIVEQHFHINAQGAVLAADLIAETRRIGAAAAIGGARMAEERIAEAQDAVLR